jgi:hypothetical protein
MEELGGLIYEKTPRGYGSGPDLAQAAESNA